MPAKVKSTSGQSVFFKPYVDMSLSKNPAKNFGLSSKLGSCYSILWKLAMCEILKLIGKTLVGSMLDANNTSSSVDYSILAVK